MRLIDANTLIKTVEGLQDCYNGFSDTYDKACIIGVIDECLTIDAVPTGIIEEVYADILGAECGDSWIQCDGIMVNTDAGYAMDGVDLFFKLLMKRIYGEVSDE